MKRLGINVLIMSIFLFVSLAEAMEKNKEICFLSDKRYDLKRYQKIKERKELTAIKKIFPGTEVNNFDILLTQKQDVLNKYKRLYIASAYTLFSLKQLAGLENFIKNGGLVISSSGLNLIDKNMNFKYDKGDKSLRKQGGIAGIIRFATVKIENIKINITCPLTKGMEEGKIVAVNWMGGRVHNVNAEVLVCGDAVYQSKQKLKDMPIVTYKKIGKGAIIFLNVLGDNKIFLKNSLSPLALEWLVDCE